MAFGIAGEYSSRAESFKCYTPAEFIDTYKGKIVPMGGEYGPCSVRLFEGFSSLKNRRLVVLMKDGRELFGKIEKINLLGIDGIGEETRNMKAETCYRPCVIFLKRKGDSEKVTIAFSRGRTHYPKGDKKYDYEDTVRSLLVSDKTEEVDSDREEEDTQDLSEHSVTIQDAPSGNLATQSVENGADALD